MRSTVVSQLKESGLSNDYISSVTGHKSASSIQRYVKTRCDIDRREISDALHDGFDVKRMMLNQTKVEDRVFNLSKEQGVFQFSGQFTNYTFNLK